MLNRFTKILLISIVAITNNIFAQSQNIKFRHLTVEDGLSHGWIKCIYKDSYGYMWFGAGNSGLNKYDGCNFTIYENNPNDKNSLSSNSITFIYEDINRNLWIGTDNSLNIYNRELNIITPISSFNGRFANDIFELDNGKFILTTDNGLILFNPENDSIIPINNFNEDSSFEFIRDGILQYNNKLLIGTGQGLFYLDTTNYQFNPIVENINIRTIIIDDYNRIWYGTQQKGLFCLSFKNNDFSKPVIKNFINNPDNINSISKSSIVALQIDNNNYLWIGTGNDGLNILNLNDLNEENITFQHYRHNPSDIFSISHNSINAIHIDNEGTVWASTYNSGISYYNKWLFKFHQFRHKENDKNSIDDNQVNAIFQDDHCLWIGTQKGLNVQNLKTKKWEHYEYDENDNKSLGAKAVCAIFRDSRNNMWIGTWAGGLNLFNETTKTFTRFLHDPNDASSISGNNIFNIKEDEEGIIWIAVLGRGLNSYDYKTNSFKSYINDPVLAKLQYRYAAVISVMDENDEILIAASGGFEILNKENEEVLHFKNNPADPKSLSSDGLTYVFKDSKRNIWLGTNNGLNLFNRDSLNFKLYNKKDGLPNNVIQAICEDDHGNLWISTNKGMSKFISGIHCPEPPVFENFDIEDGLQGNVFNARSCFKSTDGILYFGGPNGFNVFQPDSIKKNPYIPNVVFTNLLIFNKPVKIGEEGSPLTKHISLTKELTLKHNQSVITIEYSTFDYLAPDKIQYAFMMEGFEKEWNYVGNQKFATYTNLDPGEYTFHVKASNSDGFWDAEKKSIKIIITPPFWQTWIFRSIVILFMLIAIYIVDRIRIRNMELQRKKLQIQVNDKTSELSKKKEEAEKFNQRLKQEISEHKKTEVKLAQANQELYKIASHDLQEPLRTIASYVQLLKLQKKGKIDQGTDAYIKFAVEGVERMKQIILDITMYSRLETHGHSFRPTSCEEIFTQLLRNLRDTTHKNGIKITHDTLPMVKADQNQLKMVFHNLIDNAIKFKNGSETTEIHVSADKKESHWIFTIKDNGIGIDPNYHDQIFVLFQRLHAINEYKGTGIGLAVCKKIVERHGGEIWVESEGKGKGSTFYFTIPVTHS